MRPGVTHALLGANGAGKSTLSRVISGHVRRDGGEILYRGAPRDVRSPREALDAGIAMVMQETSLAPDLSVFENIFLPDLGRPGRLSRPTMRRRASEILADLGQEHAVSLDAEARDLSAAQRQLVEIAKALALKANLIIFDEPTASLSPSEVERLFDVIARLESRAMRDRLRLAPSGGSVRDLRRDHGHARGAHGRGLAADLEPQPDRAHAPDGRPRSRLDLRALLRCRRQARRARACPFGRCARPRWCATSPSILHRGEILGLGGLVGAGRSETVETLFGLRPRAGGEVRYEGKPFAPRSPSEAIRAGIGFVAEDRRRQSIVPDLSVRENLLLAHLGAHRGFGLGYGKRETKIDELMARLELPPDRLSEPNLLNFSGGMQQKIIIARWLLLEPKVLILDEPTKGVDIGTRASIYAILRDIAATGAAILIVSSEFEELLGFADRVIVVSDGASIADVPSAYLDEEKLTLLAAPRTSMERYRRLLQELADQCDGAAFWAILDDERVFCLNTATANARPIPSLQRGRRAAIRRDADLGRAEGARARISCSIRQAACKSLLVDVRSHRGHELGSIGVVIRPDASPPPAEAMRSAIQDRFRATL